jgi:hypothetical protein
MERKVLYMAAGSDFLAGLPYASCEIISTSAAVDILQELLNIEGLPPITYDPEQDTLAIYYTPSDAIGYQFHGFTPLNSDATLGYGTEEQRCPEDRWQITINDTIVYTQIDK